MTDQNRGIMKFDDADAPTSIAFSSLLILGGIAVLIWWALQVAY